MKTTVALAALAFAATAASSSLAAARGAVLKIDGQQAYVDMGTDDGVTTGSMLTLFHVIAVKHPVSGKTVRDTFPLASLRVINAGPRISIAIIPPPFLKRARVGDEIELASAPKVVVDPWTIPRQGPTDPGEDAHRVALAQRKKAVARANERLALVASVESTWRSTLGQPPVLRLAAWRKYLSDNPTTPYQRTVARAITELEALIADDEAVRSQSPESLRAQASIDALARLAGGIRRGAPLIAEHPQRIDEGVPLDMAFLVVRPDTVANAWLYHRTVGDKTYQRVALRANGDSYLVGSVPADAVRPPGVEYFVELLEVAGSAEPAAPRPVIGTDAAPLRTRVEATAGPAPTDGRGRSRVTFTLDYVDFDGIGSSTSNDQYWKGEIDFMYRFKMRGLYSLRLGFGSLEGKGGPKDVIDDDPENCELNGVYLCRDVAYNYAYTELEWHFGDYVGLMLRPQWGSAYRDNQVMANADREFFDAFGLRARLRFGREDGSNLVLGASATQELGTLFEAGFTWDVIAEVPLVFSVHVTDQPVIEDFGVRLLADIGWRKLGWVYPSLRLAYQARDIDHAGFSAGTAINFDW